MLLNTDDNNDLLFGSNDYLAAFLGVSAKQVARYKSGASKLPETARRLLKIRYGDLAGLLGSDWQGFTFQQGELFTPEFKYGFSAAEMRGWFFGRQELAYLRKEVLRLQSALDRQEKTALWAAQMVRGVSRPTPSSSAALPPPQHPTAPPPCAYFADTPPAPPRRSGT